MSKYSDDKIGAEHAHGTHLDSQVALSQDDSVSANDDAHFLDANAHAPVSCSKELLHLWIRSLFMPVRMH